MIIVDNYHKVSSSGAGENYHLNLDGILFLGKYILLIIFWVNIFYPGERFDNVHCSGGVKPSMWKELPKMLTSDFGFHGCVASLELNGVMVDPLKVTKYV